MTPPIGVVVTGAEVPAPGVDDQHALRSIGADRSIVVVRRTDPGGRGGVDVAGA